MMMVMVTMMVTMMMVMMMIKVRHVSAYVYLTSVSVSNTGM